MLKRVEYRKGSKMKPDQQAICIESSATQIYHHPVNPVDDGTIDYEWVCHETIPFNELIISWNAMRPQYGGFEIFVSVKTRAWSPWFPYAYWGSNGQWGGDVTAADGFFEIKQDILRFINSDKATGFQIRVKAVEGANLDEFYTLHACATRLEDLSIKKEFVSGPSIDLKVPLVSQMALPHVRKRDMCSPTSTSSAISYLLKMNRLDPIAFALHAHDDIFDIFGNWVLNTAHAAAVMGKRWNCWVQRLQGFGDIYKQLREGTPVVVSLKGELPGGPQPYNQGHLVVVKGYRVHDSHVLCMDPAFPDDSLTNVGYKLNDFLDAWSRRQYLAYVFKPNLRP